MWLLECLKSLFLEHLSKVNVFTGQKHRINPQDGTFILILH